MDAIPKFTRVQLDADSIKYFRKACETYLRLIHSKNSDQRRSETVTGKAAVQLTVIGEVNCLSQTDGVYGMDKFANVNGVNLWYELNGSGEPVIQLHGCGFGHFNFSTATPILSKEFMTIDFDMRGYGKSDRPEQEYTQEVWADDAVGLLDFLGIEKAHVHGTSMGGMVAQVMAAKYPERVQSVVVNCSAAKLDRYGKLLFSNWKDIALLAGTDSRLLAELISWQALSAEYLDAEGGEAAVDSVHQILSDSNTVSVFVAAVQSIIDLDIREYTKQISSPALVLGGDVDPMTPWNQGPSGAGQQWLADNIPGAEKYVIRGASHSTIFDSTDEHCRVVAEFFRRNSIASAG